MIKFAKKGIAMNEVDQKSNKINSKMLKAATTLRNYCIEKWEGGVCSGCVFCDNSNYCPINQPRNYEVSAKKTTQYKIKGKEVG